MDQEPVTVREVRVELGREAVVDLRERLARTRFAAAGDETWVRGVPRGWLQQLVEDWYAFDFDALQDRLDAMTHLRAEVSGQAVHVVHMPGTGVDPAPLLLTHGWPGSFLEYAPVVPLLTDPQDGESSYTLVIPSLPGFGFSGPPPTGGLTARDVAGSWHRLMTDGLGNDRYFAHGSDLGAGVTAWLARDHPEAVAAIHLATPGLAPAPEPRTPEEQSYAAEVATWDGAEGGYAHEHSTKPDTVAAGLMDSPAGLAAWVGEKFTAWSSMRPDGSPAVDRDLLLASLTLYWVTGTIGTSLLPYWAYRNNPDARFPVDDPAPVPTSVTIFGGEKVPFPKPPRALAERYYTLTSYAEHPTGGHFPALSEPALLAQTLRQAFPR